MLLRLGTVKLLNGAWVLLNHLMWHSLSYRSSDISLVLLLIIRCAVPLIDQVTVLKSFEELGPGLNNAVIEDPLSRYRVCLRSGWISQWLLECGDASVLPLDDILVMIILFGGAIVSALVLCPEMVLPDACIQEFLRSLGVRAVVT